MPATKSIVRLSAPEAESIVNYFLATMYGGQESYTMNGNMIESSMMIPGSTGISPSPTMMMQHPSDLYSNGGANMIASLRTHSSKFPVSILTRHDDVFWIVIWLFYFSTFTESRCFQFTILSFFCEKSLNISCSSRKTKKKTMKNQFSFDFLFPRRLFIASGNFFDKKQMEKASYLICKRFYLKDVKLFSIRSTEDENFLKRIIS